MLEHEAARQDTGTAELLRSLRNRNTASPAPLQSRDVHSVHEPAASEAQLAAESNSRVEDYLDHVLAPMVGTVAYPTRQELRRDMRLHIEQLIAAHKELGSEPAEAVTAALRQFGPPSLVTGKWLGELPHTASDVVCQEPATASVKKAFKSSARILAASVSLWVTAGVLLDNYLNGGIMTCVFLSLGAVLPLTAGYLTGRKHTGNRPVLGTLLAQAAVLLLWPFLLMFLMEVFRHVEPDCRTAAFMGLTTFAALSPTGCLGAWFGARQKRHLRNRRVTA